MPSQPLAVRSLFALGLGLVACSSDPAPNEATAPPCEGDGCPPAACTEVERTSDDGKCVPLGTGACAEGFAADPSGFGCQEILPATDCAAGAMPVLGETACVPVAAAACPSGFERRSDGWGCRAIVPAEACSGATRAALGSRTCVPVGDCNAAFPPPAATLFVSPDGPVDATHFATIGAALAAAPAGATIAIAAGTYAEALAPMSSVKLVGRCAAQVILTPTAGIGITAAEGEELDVRGVTVRGAVTGLFAEAGARIVATDVVVDASTSSGVVLANGATTIELTRSVVRKTTGADGPGYGVEVGAGATVRIVESDVSENADVNVDLPRKSGKGIIDRSVIARGVVGSQGFGNGVHARAGAIVELTASALVKNRDVGIVVFGKDSRATVTDATIEDTANGPEGYGRATIVDEGAITFERVTMAGNTDSAVVAEQAGTAILRESVVVATQPNAEGTNGFGVTAISRGSVVVTRSALVGNRVGGGTAVGKGASVALEGSIVRGTLPDEDGERGFGLSTDSGGAVSATGSALVENTTAGAGALDPGSKVTLTSSVILATKSDAMKRGGRGLTIEGGAEATIEKSAIVDNRDIGIAVKGAGGSLSVDQSVVRGTLPQDKDGTRGRGIELNTEAKGTIRRSSLVGNASVSVLAASTTVVEVTDSWIDDTKSDASQGRPGRGLTAQKGASMTMLGVVVQRSKQAGIVAGDRSVLQMKSCLFDGIASNSFDLLGHGVVAMRGSTVVAEDVTIRRCDSAGLVFDASSGVVRASRITNNGIGIATQGGSTLDVVTEAPAEPSENVVSVTADSVFTDNATRIGAGAIPVPSVL